MDFYLDTLLNLPNVTVFTTYQKEGLIFVKLSLLNEGINCPYCQNHTDNLHQNRPILVRDLSIFGQGVYKDSSPPSIPVSPVQKITNRTVII